MSLQATTWQTVGPFFKIGLAWLYQDDIAGPGASGDRVTIEGQILDADGHLQGDLHATLLRSRFASSGFGGDLAVAVLRSDCVDHDCSARTASLRAAAHSRAWLPLDAGLLGIRP